mgnify:CR=1 FL=1
MKKKVTISDIAEQSGVSPSTVSLILNNKPGVSDETRERVLDVAAELLEVLRTEFVLDEVTEIDPKNKRVGTKKGRKLNYDFLVVALGCRIAPEEVEGMMEGWGKNVHTFYSLDGAVALAKALKFFDKGRLVLNIAEIPFKCPVAPLEFVFLADWFFHERGVRDKVEIELVTPLPHAFTKPKAAAILGDFCERKNIIITPNFNIGEVNAAEGYIEELGAEGRKVNFDLLVAIPPNLGPR